MSQRTVTKFFAVPSFALRLDFCKHEPSFMSIERIVCAFLVGGFNLGAPESLLCHKEIPLILHV